jgi:two-component system phosphate regulon sensor histidine kinase PhoR
VSGVTVATAPGAKRFPGLPWAIRGEWKEEPGLAEEFAQRRRAMLGFVGIAVLLTAGSALFLWRAFARERALNRLQSDFVSAVSHEFRTPLTNMKQITEVLSEGRLIQEDRRQTYYDSLGRATQRLQRLVESLLDFARMEANAMPYRRDRIILQEMIRGMGNDFTHEFGRSGFRLEMKAPEEPLVVLGDRDALHQALWNLLDNAVKYSPKTRNIWLEAGQHGSLALLRVRDEGIGIPENERRQILKKFVRGEAAKAAGIVGTGLGLSLADHVVRAHGGTLEVESELGKGSRFTILLPLEASCIASS